MKQTLKNNTDRQREIERQRQADRQTRTAQSPCCIAASCIILTILVNKPMLLSALAHGLRHIVQIRALFYHCVQRLLFEQQQQQHNQ